MGQILPMTVAPRPPSRPLRIGLLGAGGDKVGPMVDLALIVPHGETPRIQEVHIAASHIICQLIEDELCPL